MSNSPNDQAYKTKEQRILTGVKKWASFHRANPQRFVKDYLKVKLHLFQQILLYMCFQVEFFMYLAARGQGKSWLIALICIVRCILYPNTVIILASGTKGQARLIITQKVVDFRNRYPNIRREILEGNAGIKTGANDCAVYFKNGSRIEAVTSNDNARGYRGNILVLDEFRLIKEDILKKVLRPFLNVNRQPPYLMKPEYKHLQEENKEIYISSAWYKNHWCWKKFSSFAKAMCRTDCDSHFACGLNYKLSLEHGILTPKRVEAIRKEEDFDDISWLMEMDCVFFGENEKSFFKLDDIHKNRNIVKPFYPINHFEYLQNKGKGRLKNKNIPKRQEGEIRILGVDVAMMGK